MTIKRENKTIFIISLILHILFVLLLLFSAFKNRQKVVIIKPAKKRDAGGMPAALLPKRSDHGTKVVFDDSVILPPPKAVAEEKEETPAPRHRDQKSIKKLVEKVLKKKKEDANRSSRVPAEALAKAGVPPQAVYRGMIKELQEPDPPSPSPFAKATEDASELRGTDRQADLKEVALANMLKEVKDHEKTEQKQVKVQPKKKSLLSLSKCFLDHEKGNSCLMRYGANRFPSLEEMKYICYEKQIEDHIISTWRSLYSGRPMQMNGKASISFLINEDGSVEDLRLVGSSHNKMFDDMVLKCIRSTVFPPIPKHFGVKKYRPRGGYTMLPAH